MDRRINLLPPEIAARRKARQAWAATGVAGVVLLAALGGFYFLQTMRLADEQEKLEQQEQINADLQRRAAQLAQFEQLQQELANRLGLLDQLTAREVRWSGVLADISLVIPNNVWLNGFTGSLTAGDQPQAAAQPGVPAVIGDVQMAGSTFEHIDVAQWLARLAGVDRFLFPYISLSSRGELFGVDIVNFNSSVQLNELALRKNQRGGERRL